MLEHTISRIEFWQENFIEEYAKIAETNRLLHSSHNLDIGMRM
jgi:hypothetical protein